jgi:hypothetical protein
LSQGIDLKVQLRVLLEYTDSAKKETALEWLHESCDTGSAFGSSDKFIKIVSLEAEHLKIIRRNIRKSIKWNF